MPLSVDEGCNVSEFSCQIAKSSSSDMNSLVMVLAVDPRDSLLAMA